MRAYRLTCLSPLNAISYGQALWGSVEALFLKKIELPPATGIWSVSFDVVDRRNQYGIEEAIHPAVFFAVRSC